VIVTPQRRGFYPDEPQTGNDVHQALSAMLDQMQQRDLPIECAFRITRHHEPEAAEFYLQRLRDPDLPGSEQALILQLILMCGVTEFFIGLLLGPASPIDDSIVSRLAGAGLTFQVKLAAYLRPANRDTTIRGLALLKALGASPVIVPRLFAIVYQSALPQIQDMAVELINELDARLVYTRRLLHHPDPRIRASALRLISASDEKNGREYLRLFASDPDIRVRSMAALELHRRRDPLGPKILCDMIAKDDPDMRRSAIWALGMEGGEVAISILKKLQAQDPNEGVRRQAALALQKIAETNTDRSAVNPMNVDGHDAPSPVPSSSSAGHLTI
jgi:hypothetical protein